MNKNWRNRPTNIELIPAKSINWVLFIDESGNPSLSAVQKAQRLGVNPHENEVHFTVTGCAIKMTDFINNRDLVMTVKNRYWLDGLYQYGKENKRVCFHSREIRGKRDAFNPTQIDYPRFIEDLSGIMVAAQYKLFAADINKQLHIERYAYPDPPYSLCMDFVLERFVCNINHNETGIIILESRGKVEDKELLEHIIFLIDHGSRYVSNRQFQKIKGVYFNSKWSKESANQKSYWGLELADLCAYPIYKYLVYGHADRAFDAIKPKIHHFPHIDGYGLKMFPK